MKRLLLLLSTIILFMCVLSACSRQSNEYVSSRTTDRDVAQITSSATHSEDIAFPEIASSVSFESNGFSEFLPGKYKIGVNIVSNFRGEYETYCSSDMWNYPIGIDYSSFDFIGTLRELCDDVQTLSDRVSFYKYCHDNMFEKEELTVVSVNDVIVAAKYKEDQDKSYNVFYTEIEVTEYTEISSITARQGSYISVDLYSNVPLSYFADISTRFEGNNIICKSEIFGCEPLNTDDGVIYKVTVNLTVPYIESGTYYLSLKRSCNGNMSKTIPLEIKKAESDKKYHLLFEGSWDKIKDGQYMEELETMFETLYPVYNERIGIGVPDTVTFIADPDFSGDAYSIGSSIRISVDYANKNPDSIDGFARELANVLLSECDFDSKWLAENISSYFLFRYRTFADSNDKNNNIIFEDDSYLDWGYAPYGKCELFFAYLDDKYPTTKASDGNISYGLIDTLLLEVINGNIKNDNDPKNPSGELSKFISDFTRGKYKTIDELRKKYVDDVRLFASSNGKRGWTFTGFDNI